MSEHMFGVSRVLQWGRGHVTAEMAARVSILLSKSSEATREQRRPLNVDIDSDNALSSETQAASRVAAASSCLRCVVTLPLDRHGAHRPSSESAPYLVSNPGYRVSSPLTYLASSRAWISSTRR